VEVAIGCLVDVIHAFTVHNSAYISKAVSIYMILLLAKVLMFEIIGMLRLKVISYASYCSKT
jgi:hypothetical protein